MYIPLWIIVIGVVIWFIYARNKEKAQQNISVITEEKEVVISEETVFKVQSKFEDKITNETEFPDAISGDEIYIYKNLMRPWFDKLIAQYRYDEKMIQKLRNDWLDYMEAVGDRSTYNYLSLESQDEKQSEKYREDHIVASRKMFAIQDAFATAIGADAVSELKKVKEMGFMSFSRNGELALEGFKWDLGRRELVPIKEMKKTHEK
ncbi:MAG: hypothetical protein NT003_02235 [Candidatus Magasanikbacteria bacterium]|nr:hypothetical protein [Candidatus Magasanikbacteria bacterium]